LDRANSKKLVLTINPQGKKLSLQLSTESRFLRKEDCQGRFSCNKKIEGQGPQEIVIDRKEFKNSDGKTLEWSKIATFNVVLVDLDTREKIDLTSPKGHAILQSIKLGD